MDGWEKDVPDTGSPGDNLANLIGDSRLTGTVVDDGELVGQLLGVVGGGLERWVGGW